MPRKVQTTPLTAENFPDIFLATFDKVTAPFYNGSDIPTDKPIRYGVADMSKNVRSLDTRVANIDDRLNKTTEETKENSELLEDKKQRKAAVASLVSIVKSMSPWQKIVITAFLLHYSYEVLSPLDWTKIFETITGFFIHL